MNLSRRLVCAGLLAGGLPAAWAQSDKSLRWIVPYQAGGGTDTVARLLADEMRHQLKQTLVIDNRPGGATNIGMEAVHRATPDGSTIGTADNAALMVNEHLFAKLSYRPAKDFSYIAMMVKVPLVLVTTQPVRDLQGLLAQAKAASSPMGFASAGVGSPHHLAMELLKRRSQAPLEHVAYRGSSQAIPDLLSGQIQAMFLELPVAKPLIETGKLKAIAVGGAQRSELLKNVPTVAEQGLSGFDAYAFQGLVGPARMSAEQTTRLREAVRQALQSPAVLARFADMGIEPWFLGSDAFFQLCQEESQRWGKLLREAKIQVS
ncbi:Bug family tripartite tricarboxylate transporter substrate binding protein [Comamonas composti]|uniref:Bug family tripartite tricarboxylate transporter substrate binding protein n=1 Tax=Comamonas composti TaxID=408558 RepID=UPI00041A31BA|nr:tripartite tricarboxylate transporter substrate binding protein [Comamonas composti]